MSGSIEGMKEIKKFDKDTMYRIQFSRMNNIDRRNSIKANIFIDGNFNIL